MTTQAPAVPMESISSLARIARDLDLLKFDALFTTAALLRGGRPTHTKGVAVTGSFEVTSLPTYPKNTFFTPGRTFDIVLRHGNVAYDDDAAMDIRGAALRLVAREGEGDHKPERPIHLATPAMDLLMNTGEVSFSSAKVFLDFARASGGTPGHEGPVDVRALEAYFKPRPVIRRQFEIGLRRAPSSFTRLRYHSQIPLRFHGGDGKERYARFRLVPGDGAPEEGFPSASDLATPWLQDRHVGETRDFQYMRDEMKARAHAHATYALEMQVYEPAGQVDVAMLDPGRAWDEEALPFHAVGRITLDKALHPKRTEDLAYNIGHLPAAFSLVPCRTLSDFGSIGFVRAHVYTVTQRVRRVMRKMKRLGELGRQKKKRHFRSKKHFTKDDKRRDSSLVGLIFGHVWRG